MSTLHFYHLEGYLRQRLLMLVLGMKIMCNPFLYIKQKGLAVEVLFMLFTRVGLVGMSVLNVLFML